jgi:hypothetical protein
MDKVAEWGVYRQAEFQKDTQAPGAYKDWTVSTNTEATLTRAATEAQDAFQRVLANMTAVVAKTRNKVLNIKPEVEKIGASLAGIAQNIQDLEEIGESLSRILKAMTEVGKCKGHLAVALHRIRNRQRDNRSQNMIDQCDNILTDDLRNDFNSSGVCNSSDKTSSRRLLDETLKNSYIPDLFNMDEDAKRDVCFGFHSQITDSTYTHTNCDAGVTPGECGQGADDPDGMDWPTTMTDAVTGECTAFFSVLRTRELTGDFQRIVDAGNQLDRMTDILNGTVKYVAATTQACNEDLGNIKRAYESNVEKLYKVFQCQRLVGHQYNEIAKITSTTATSTSSTTTSTEFEFTPSSDVAPTFKCVGLLPIFAAMHMVVAVLC